MDELDKIRQEQDDQAIIRRRLLRAAMNFATPEEMSEATGGVMNPAEAYLYVDSFLRSRAGTWDEVQQRQMVIYRLMEFMETLREDVEMGSPQARNTYLAAIRTHLDALDKHQISLSDINTKLTSDQGAFFVRALLEAFNFMSQQFAEQGVILPDDAKQGILEGAAEVGLNKLAEFTMQKVEDGD